MIKWSFNGIVKNLSSPIAAKNFLKDTFTPGFLKAKKPGKDQDLKDKLQKDSQIVEVFNVLEDTLGDRSLKSRVNSILLE